MNDSKDDDWTLKVLYSTVTEGMHADFNELMERFVQLNDYAGPVDNYLLGMGSVFVENLSGAWIDLQAHLDDFTHRLQGIVHKVYESQGQPPKLRTQVESLLGSLTEAEVVVSALPDAFSRVNDEIRKHLGDLDPHVGEHHLELTQLSQLIEAQFATPEIYGDMRARLNMAAYYAKSVSPMDEHRTRQELADEVYLIEQDALRAQLDDEVREWTLMAQANSSNQRDHPPGWVRFVIHASWTEVWFEKTMQWRDAVEVLQFADIKENELLDYLRAAGAEKSMMLPGVTVEVTDEGMAEAGGVAVITFAVDPAFNREVWAAHRNGQLMRYTIAGEHGEVLLLQSADGENPAPRYVRKIIEKFQRSGGRLAKGKLKGKLGPLSSERVLRIECHETRDESVVRKYVRDVLRNDRRVVKVESLDSVASNQKASRTDANVASRGKAEERRARAGEKRGKVQPSASDKRRADIRRGKERVSESSKATLMAQVGGEIPANYPELIAWKSSHQAAVLQAFDEFYRGFDPDGFELFSALRTFLRSPDRATATKVMEAMGEKKYGTFEVNLPDDIARPLYDALVAYSRNETADAPVSRAKAAMNHLYTYSFPDAYEINFVNKVKGGKI